MRTHLGFCETGGRYEVDVVECDAGHVPRGGTSSALSAQSKTITGEATTITATIEAIDATTRTLTVKDSRGNFVPITVSKSVERFSEFKVGDTITARYYDNIVIRLKPAGEAAVDTTAADVTRGSGAEPRG